MCYAWGSGPNDSFRQYFPQRPLKWGVLLAEVCRGCGIWEGGQGGTGWCQKVFLAVGQKGRRRRNLQGPQRWWEKREEMRPKSERKKRHKTLPTARVSRSVVRNCFEKGRASLISDRWETQPPDPPWHTQNWGQRGCVARNWSPPQPRTNQMNREVIPLG